MKFIWRSWILSKSFEDWQYRVIVFPLHFYNLFLDHWPVSWIHVCPIFILQMDYDVFYMHALICEYTVQFNLIKLILFSYKLQSHIENSLYLIPDHIFSSLSRQNIMTTTHVKSFWHDYVVGRVGKLKSKDDMLHIRSLNFQGCAIMIISCRKTSHYKQIWCHLK